MVSHSSFSIQLCVPTQSCHYRPFFYFRYEPLVVFPTPPLFVKFLSKNAFVSFNVIKFLAFLGRKFFSILSMIVVHLQVQGSILPTFYAKLFTRSVPIRSKKYIQVVSLFCPFVIWAQFHQHSTYSFYRRRSQKRKRY